MVTCPRCTFADPTGANPCARCGYPIPAPDTPALVAAEEPTVLGSGSGSADNPIVAPYPAGSAVLSAPLPPPMVEPILTPTTPPPDSKPFPSHPVFTLPLRSVTSTPAPSTQAEVVLPAQAPAPPLTAVTVRARTAPPATPMPAPPAAPQVRARLVVLRGERIGVEYPIYEGRNTVGRFVDRPVDIDLLAQESESQVWCSRLHAAFTLDRGTVTVEDLNSLNGTWVNGARLTPGQPRTLKPNDVVQVGTVQLKLLLG